jgi:hypothetical protein
MLREFKFFRGYNKPTLTEQWEELMQQFPTPITNPINWTGTTHTPTWIVNPGLIQYTPPNYNTLTIPNYNITTTPGLGTYTIPLSGTINTATGFSLTTSNPNGVTYTTGGMGGTLTTGTQLFTNTGYSTTGTLTTSTFK